jgi:hypothetical protein
MATMNTSQEAHIQVMRQRRKMEEEEGKVVAISDALDVLLGISNKKEVK